MMDTSTRVIGVRRRYERQRLAVAGINNVVLFSILVLDRLVISGN